MPFYVIFKSFGILEQRLLDAIFVILFLLILHIVVPDHAMLIFLVCGLFFYALFKIKNKNKQKFFYFKKPTAP